ncbi:hypothetical protein [Phenylobacterium sp.]|uniref:hypothetical protein n=1 Tax=Phenylobacterium sp. TaxID=1871053 RepID=UPI002733D87D|nr:hypothetical protein [Phenylobacterium sp.]MDP3633568.1 hypothetical protein [Phenylobacterium sp.]MDP3869950.1 hypothetical protein [Phenylobacterium sp.]
MRKEPPALSGLYLEDSYFLGLLVSGATLRIRGLFALTRDHEAYAAPASGEQHCYREGEIALTGVQVTEWVAGKPTLLRDPDGSMDLGSLSIGDRNGGYQISTEWFDMICRADALSVTLD